MSTPEFHSLLLSTNNSRITFDVMQEHIGNKPLLLTPKRVVDHWTKLLEHKDVTVLHLQNVFDGRRLTEHTSVLMVDCQAPAYYTIVKKVLAKVRSEVMVYNHTMPTIMVVDCEPTKVVYQELASNIGFTVCKNE